MPYLKNQIEQGSSINNNSLDMVTSLILFNPDQWNLAV